MQYSSIATTRVILYYSILLNPLRIIEVLPASTEANDRGLKFFHYQLIPSLRDYLLVTQNFVESNTINVMMTIGGFILSVMTLKTRYRLLLWIVA